MPNSWSDCSPSITGAPQLQRGFNELTENEDHFAMAKLQRQYKAGTEYNVVGPSNKKRRLLFVGKFNLNRKEILMFHVVRKASKHKNPN
jgi:hypothetical protein